MEPDLVQVLAAMHGADCQRRVQPGLRAQYATFTGVVWEGLKLSQLNGRTEFSNLEAPSLAVVHSIIGRPSSMTMPGVQALIYDQYLGQMLSRLSRLALSRAAREAVDPYLSKIFAQRLFVSGRFDVALGVLASGMSADGGRSPQLPKETSAQLSERSALVAAQEAFVIGHELTHVLLGSIPGLREELTDELVSMIGGVSAPEIDVSTFTAFMDQSRDRTRARYDLEPDGQSALDPAETAMRDLDHAAELRSRPDLLEECLCDYAGAVAAMFGCAGGLKVLPEHSFAGSGMALHNLRLIQVLDRFADPAQEVTSEFLRDSALRLSINRRSMLSFCHLMPGELFNVEKLRMRMIEFNEAHAEILLDPLLFVLNFDSAVQRAAQTVAAGDVSAEPWGSARRMRLRGLLGFD